MYEDAIGAARDELANLEAEQKMLQDKADNFRDSFMKVHGIDSVEEATK